MSIVEDLAFREPRAGRRYKRAACVTLVAAPFAQSITQAVAGGPQRRSTLEEPLWSQAGTYLYRPFARKKQDGKIFYGDEENSRKKFLSGDGVKAHMRGPAPRTIPGRYSR